MNPQPPAPTCYRHPDRTTRLACTRCGRPACPECLQSAAVGQHCVECVAQARRETRTVQGPAGSPATTTGRPTPYITYALIAVNVAVFAATASQAHSVTNNHLSQLFYDWVLAPQAVANGQWLRVITSGFLHYGPLHLLVNMFALYIIGRDTEMVLGRMRFLAVYVAALLGGSAAVMWLDTDAVTAGASGAIYGLFGAMTVILLRLRQSPAQMLVLIVINVVISVSVPGISLWGHLGGLLAGTLATVGVLYLPQWLRSGNRDAVRWIGWGSIAGVMVAALVAIGAAAAVLA